MDWIKAVIMGIVEGVTEFLPVSSTGHLIVAKSLLHFEINDAFEVIIQMGAILAVVVIYFSRFIGLLNLKAKEGLAGPRGVGLLALTCLPAFTVAFFTHDWIKQHLFNNATVAIGLAVGGVWILATEYALKRPPRVTMDTMTWREALTVGLFQCLALWPGMSRSSSTILGGMLAGLDRKSATEFSFFAAVPILVVAGLFDLLDNLNVLTGGDLKLVGLGLVVSFISAWAAIRLFVHFVSRHTLSPFGWYRLAVAAMICCWAEHGDTKQMIGLIGFFIILFIPVFLFDLHVRRQDELRVAAAEQQRQYREEAEKKEAEARRSEQRRRQAEREQFENERRRTEDEQKRNEEHDRRQRTAYDRPATDSEEKRYGAILNLRGQVSPEDVTKRYRELVTQYHPDKVNHLGPKLKAVAEQEMKEINAAYEYFRQKYGIT